MNNVAAAVIILSAAIGLSHCGDAVAAGRERITDASGRTVGYVDSYAGRERVTDRYGSTLYWVERNRWNDDIELNDATTGSRRYKIDRDEDEPSDEDE